VSEGIRRATSSTTSAPHSKPGACALSRHCCAEVRSCSRSLARNAPRSSEASSSTSPWRSSGDLHSPLPRSAREERTRPACVQRDLDVPAPSPSLVPVVDPGTRYPAAYCGSHRVWTNETVPCCTHRHARFTMHLGHLQCSLGSTFRPPNGSPQDPGTDDNRGGVL